MKEVKSKLNELANLNNNELHEYLNSFDPESADNIHPNNRKRVLRAIEYYLKTKKLLSYRKKVQQFTENYDKKINKRVDIMLSHGLFNEVQHLVEQGYESSQSMQAIGYKELIPVVKGNMDLQSATDKLKQNSRKYAKRQLTWFKNKMNVHWLDRENMSLQMMLDEITPQINKRSTEHDCKRKHPRSSTREL
ncbi:tRNA delta(2)-isopentenylpyrophosphate transferase MiaA [Mycobacteroides abscessus subsp. abscessus]|nr:tRNA delta(2)-isopentenylpyrophosphate transferase MiaA [Mycobacteroides abscessus subsp. abscessus]